MILVAGGTGTLGTTLVRMLSRHGDTVRAGALSGPAFVVPPQGPV